MTDSSATLNGLSKLTSGTYTDIYVCKDGVTLLKVVRDNKHLKLLNQEAKIVTLLRKTGVSALFPELLSNTLLQPCDTCPQRFKCFTSNKIKCSLKNDALQYRYDKDMPDLNAVIKAYPSGIDERDMVWMFKRLLASLYITHSLGIVHGAVLPEHILLNLKTHGIVLIDWMHTHNVGQPPDLKYDLYVNNKEYLPDYNVTESNSTSFDICMASKCMIKIIGGIDKASKDIRLILRACEVGASDAREIHKQLEVTVKRLYGSVFRPLKV